MMKKPLFPFVCACIFLACNSNKSSEANTDSSTIDTSIISSTQQHCYTYIKDRDTARITMMSSGEITTGELSYSLFEKDKSKGIFEGELHGDTLIAEYTYNAEGRESVRQVAFLKKGSQLLEGYGDVAEKNGKWMFKDTKNLQFGKGIVFTKSDCY